jgi:hypothetical protein
MPTIELPIPAIDYGFQGATLKLTQSKVLQDRTNGSTGTSDTHERREARRRRNSTPSTFQNESRIEHALHEAVDWEKIDLTSFGLVIPRTRSRSSIGDGTERRCAPIVAED